MSIAILALLGVISSTQAAELTAAASPNTSDWSQNDLTCHFGIDRLNHGDNGDWANHAKGSLYSDATFPAARSSLYWDKYQSSSVRSTYSASTVSW
jgi:hypothetical protein